MRYPNFELVRSATYTRDRLLERHQGILRRLRRLGFTPDQLAKVDAPIRRYVDYLNEGIDEHWAVKSGFLDHSTELTDLGEQLIRARLRRGLSQESFAGVLGVTKAQVSKDERTGYRGVSLRKAQRLLDALDVDIDITLMYLPSAIQRRPSPRFNPPAYWSADPLAE